MRLHSCHVLGMRVPLFCFALAQLPCPWPILWLSHARKKAPRTTPPPIRDISSGCQIRLVHMGYQLEEMLRGLLDIVLKLPRRRGSASCWTRCLVEAVVLRAGLAPVCMGGAHSTTSRSWICPLVRSVTVLSRRGRYLLPMRFLAKLFTVPASVLDTLSMSTL